MVGGKLFIEQPDLVAKIGADFTAADGKQAVVMVEGLFNHLEKS